jgi:hypothetical protein
MLASLLRPLIRGSASFSNPPVRSRPQGQQPAQEKAAEIHSVIMLAISDIDIDHFFFKNKRLTGHG